MNTELAAPRVKSRRNLPPRPPGWPILGNIPLPGADWLAGFERATRTFGDVVYFQFLHVPMILLVHPEAIESVLLTNPANFMKSRDYRALAKVLGNGLLTSEGDTWRAQRKMLQPAFRRENILSYAPVMTDCAAQLMGRWSDGETRDLHQEMMALTLDIVGKALFGTDVLRSASRVGSALETAMKQFTHIAGWAFLLPESFPVPGTFRMRRATRQLDEVIYGIIHQRRDVQQSAQRRLDGSAPADLLGSLLEIRDDAGQPLSDIELRDQLMTLFLAGHETTAIALSWTWYLLAQNPEVERKLHAELGEILAGRAPSAADLPRLPYTEMVIKESMRLYPPAWGIGRQSRTEFEAGGYQLPARTNIFMLQWVTQRDARWFPEPERFIPERWRDEVLRGSESSANGGDAGPSEARNGGAPNLFAQNHAAKNQKRPRFSYFPFGGGPRVCIGAGLAMMETTLLLATIAQRYRFTLVPEHPVTIWPSVTLRPKHGIKAVLHER